MYIHDERDGQLYRTVKIGSQRWMAENLNYFVDSSWCYDNEIINCEKYGRLYNWWYARSTCPLGWHLPDTREYRIIQHYFGMSFFDSGWAGWRPSGDVGLKLKSMAGWYNNGNGTNESGFNAIPGGVRYSNGTFYNIETNAHFWVYNQFDRIGPMTGSAFTLAYDNPGVYGYYAIPASGFSVRCVMDE